MRFYNKKKKKFNFKVVATSIVAITLIGIVGLSVGRYSGVNKLKTGVILDGISVVQKNFNTGFKFLSEQVGNIVNYKKNANKIDKLEKEKKQLKEQIAKLNNSIESVSSLENLKKSMNFIDESYKAASISAKIVGKNDGNWYSSFVIGAGSANGVKKNSIVINGNGLVGIVYEVSKNYSKAISLVDSSSSVSFKLQKKNKSESGGKGIITNDSGIDKSQDYKEKGYLQGYMFDDSYEALPGDVVYTSGLGLYPEGIPIGELDKVVDDKNKTIKYVVVKPYANFKNLDDVVIIEPRSTDGKVD